ncbi:MAG: 4'-phosphopantetheinyl transferase superfamily protein [Leptolyngbyaceae cyanobacterium MAG.088]|nr:4'-phosphopantetheinyl transferase superfamily protein [Leptolyngbyaceae cyanobacterium MAG.088]
METVENHLSSGTWIPPTADCYTTLGQTTLDLWRIPLNQAAQVDVLSADELTRRDRYRFEADQRKFAVARSSLRCILASYAQTRPAELTFDYGPHGKPALHNDRSLQFNLSHSGEYALCGVARQVVGIDIEQLRAITHLDGMIQRCLAPSEQQALTKIAQTEQSTGFLTYWTCKEAYLKATGQGIINHLASVEVDLAPSPKLNVPGQPWQLKVFAPCDGYTAAVVVPTNINQIRLWTFI